MHHHQHHYRRQTSNRHQINPNGSVSTSSDETIEPSSFGSSTAPPNNRIRTNPNYFGVEFRCKDGRLRSTYIQIDPSKKRNIFMLTSPIATSTSDRKNLLEPSPQDEHNAPSQKSSLGESLRSGFKRHRRRPTMEVLSWSKAQISHPLLDLKSKHLRKEALDCFKLVQAYMGDDDRSEPNVDIAAKNKPEIGLVCSGWNFVGLRNEIYMQLVKQTTNNMNLTSLQRGIELIAICLWFFPPSPTYRLLVESHIKHLMSSLSFSSTSSSIVVSVKACHDRLEKIALDGPRKGLKNPSPDEIDLAKRTIYHISMFGSSLEALMAIQASYLPDDGLPWILTLLSNEVLRLNGAQTEGIFRIPGDIDRVNMLKAKCDRWQLLTDRRMLVDILVFNNDPHVPASLLKLWYRQLADPLIPYDLYDDCIRLSNKPSECVKIVRTQLPLLNRRVLIYLVRYLQIFARSHNVAVTKMDVNNLALVMAPNCFRCQSNEPAEIVKNAGKEMQFLKSLLIHIPQHYDEDDEPEGQLREDDMLIKL